MLYRIRRGHASPSGDSAGLFNPWAMPTPPPELFSDRTKTIYKMIYPSPHPPLLIPPPRPAAASPPSRRNLTISERNSRYVQISSYFRVFPPRNRLPLRVPRSVSHRKCRTGPPPSGSCGAKLALGPCPCVGRSVLSVRPGSTSCGESVIQWVGLSDPCRTR